MKCKINLIGVLVTLVPAIIDSIYFKNVWWILMLSLIGGVNLGYFISHNAPKEKQE